MQQNVFKDIAEFSARLQGYQLRPYQLEPARAIIEAVTVGAGGKFGLLFSRQSGKDEMVAQLIAFLMLTHQEKGGQIIMAAPTKRQADISRHRLLARLQNFEGVKNSDYIIRLGKAEARFLSAAPSANVRGETASLLLIANESQDILPNRWDAVFDPMAASTNSVTLFMGTPWTGKSLLAREMRFLREHAPSNLFRVDWKQVAALNPAYGQRVEQRIAQFGIDHPYIRTEYFLEEIGQEGYLFNAARQEAMCGTHPRQLHPTKGKIYALLVDVAGEDEAEMRLDEPSPRRDATAVSIIEIDQQSLLPLWEGGNEFLPALIPTQPLYKLVQRYAWTGLKHTNLYGQLLGIYQRWGCRVCVVDATGVGAGLASFLSKAIGPKQVVPFIFSQKSKSELGWDFLGVVDGGRFRHYTDDGANDTRLFWEQVRACEHEIRPGPGHIMRWSVPNQQLHDDLLISAALTATLDHFNWKPRIASVLKPQLSSF